MKQAREATKNRRDWTRLFQKVIIPYEYVLDFENWVYFLEGGGCKCWNFNTVCFTGLLQYFVPEANHADHPERTESENTAGFQKLGLH